MADISRTGRDAGSSAKIETHKVKILRYKNTVITKKYFPSLLTLESPSSFAQGSLIRTRSRLLLLLSLIFQYQALGMKRATDVQTRTSKKELFSCGVGNFYNDLVDKVLMSFALVYYMKVATLSGRQAGIILVAGQLSTFIANALFGYCCDRVDVPFLSQRVGRRKTWHLIGTIFTAVFFMLSFIPCLFCTESSSSLVKFAYFMCVFSMASFWYGAVEMGHISVIPEIAKNQDECVLINSLR